MTIINGISDTIRGRLANFEKYLKNFTDAQEYRDNFYKNINKANLLNNKTNRGKINIQINFLFKRF